MQTTEPLLCTDTSDNYSLSTPHYSRSGVYIQCTAFLKGVLRLINVCMAFESTYYHGVTF